MIRDLIYYMPKLISIIGLFSIILALKNKYRNNNKLIIIFNIINIVYLLIISVLHNFLPIIVDMRILIIWLISFVGGILYLISTIICIFRRKKTKENFENKLIVKLFLVIILTPIIIFTIFVYKEVQLINKSEFILCYNSSGNGGLGDYYDFVYVVNTKSCKEISIDVDLSYSDDKMFLPKKMKEITENELQHKGYKVVIDNEYIKVYKNKELIHKKKLNDRYFNTELSSILYNEQ